jgi:hypothetical protein
MHNIPHIAFVGHTLKHLSNDFGIYDGDYWNTYTRSLLGIPVMIMGLGGLALFILSLSLCLRICCKCCRCVPTEIEDEDMGGRKRLLSADVNKSSKLQWVIIFFAGLAICVDQVVIWGNRDLTVALNTVDNAMGFLDNSFQSLNTDGNNLEVLGAYLYGNASEASVNGCPLAGTYLDEINSFNEDVSEFVGYVEPLPGYLNQAQDSIHAYAIDDKNYSVWVLYSVAFVTAVLFIVGLYFKSKVTLQLTIALAIFDIIVLILLCGAEMVLLVRLIFVCCTDCGQLIMFCPCYINADWIGRLLHESHGQHFASDAERQYHL